MNDLKGETTLVVGASRGLGRGIAEAFNDAGASVIAVGRDRPALDNLATERAGVVPEVADAADPTAAGMLLDRHSPSVLAIVAGAVPLPRPLHQQTWETFSANWNTDVRIAFHWLRESLLRPLDPGARIIVMSSGAAVQGSPISGGYAGAKATVRFIANYANEEAERAELGITVRAVLPKLTPNTELGRAGAAGYARRAGISYDTFVEQLGDPLTPQTTGAAFVQLATNDVASALAYLLTSDGLQPLP